MEELNIIVTATTCGGEMTQVIILPPGEINFDKIYQLPTGYCVTLTSGETTTQFANSMLSYGPFDTCDECAMPFSANTGGNGGLICEDDCNGGNILINPPRPVYTNGQNKAIVQLNAVTIGGNGLNS